MIVAIEPVSAVLRVFLPGKQPGRDPYALAGTSVYSDDGKTVELKGITSREDDSTDFLAMRRQIARAFYLQGVDVLKWERRRSDGRVKVVYLDTKTARPSRRERSSN